MVMEKKRERGAVSRRGGFRRRVSPGGLTRGWGSLVVSLLTWALAGPAQAQQGVPLPQGMPNTPQGVSRYGVRVRRAEPQRRAGDEEGRQGRRGQGRDRERGGTGGQGGTFEIYGTTPLGVPRFAVVGGHRPAYYIVRPGDTLWDISATYFQDPWYWPKLWALNPSITNPHWIYPGDRIRLRKGAKAKKSAPVKKKTKRFGVIKNKIYGPTQTVALRQTGYLEEEKIKKAGVVKGSFHEKIMLATYDIIYIKMNPKRLLEVGERYTIFKPVKKVRSPNKKKKKPIGRIIKIYADVEIKSIHWKNKAKKRGIAKGVILRAVNPVERGYLVGKLVRRFRSVKPIKNTTLKDVKGVILEVFGQNNIIGTRQLVFINRGKNHKIKKGHVFFVVRRGDAYRRIMEKRHKEKRSEKHYPAERIAALVVIDVGDKHSTALVRNAQLELRVGDHVKLQYSGPKGSKGDEGQGD